MAKPKLTRWFAGTKKPAIEGVYERSSPAAFSGIYSYFDGKTWGLSARTPELAERNRWLSSVWQEVKWRGLAEAASNENSQRGSDK